MTHVVIYKGYIPQKYVGISSAIYIKTLIRVGKKRVVGYSRFILGRVRKVHGVDF